MEAAKQGRTEARLIEGGGGGNGAGFSADGASAGAGAGAAAPAPAPTPAPAPAPAPADKKKEDVTGIKVVQLRQALEDRGLDTGGSKGVLSPIHANKMTS